MVEPIGTATGNPTVPAATVRPFVSAERWGALEPLLDAALALAPEHRDAYLRNACAGDDARYTEVVHMLADCESDDRRLDRPAAARFATLLVADDAGDDTGPLRGALDGRYTLGRELGRGGMGVVYLARDVRHERPVALKVLRPTVAASASAERFLTEIRVTAGLRHPHILPLFDSGAAADRLFYVMPYVDGGTLRDRLRREGALPLGDALRVLREVAGALAHAHARGVVHRDVKPENVLLGEGGAVLADFGIAEALAGAAGDGAERLPARLTPPRLGTPAYMAPEQLRADAPVDHRADLYALGVLGYEMLAGDLPCATSREGSAEGAAPPAATPHARLEPLEPLARRRRDVPPALDQLVAGLLTRAPAARVQSAEDVVRALETLARDGARGGASRARVLAGFVAVVVTALLVAAWTRRPLSENLAVPVAAGRGGTLLAEAGRAVRAGNVSVARRLFAAAARDDSADARAWLGLAQTEWAVGNSHWSVSARRAAARPGALGSEDGRAPTLARAMLAYNGQDPDWLRVTSAAARAYPTDVTALMLDGGARTWGGDFNAGIAELRRAVALDSAAIAGDTSARPDASAYLHLIAALQLADSATTAEHVARRWIERNPWSLHARMALAEALATGERYDEALAAVRAAATVGDRADLTNTRWIAAQAYELAWFELRARRYHHANVLLEGIVRGGSADEQREALVLLVRSLRAQRRYADALDAARDLRRRFATEVPRSPVDGAQEEALVLQETGRPRAAARIFDSLALYPDHPGYPGEAARTRVMWGAAAADALADAGDTTDLVRRADSLAADGQRTGYGHDRRFHHFVRGRLWAARGGHARAVAEYRAAVFCPTCDPRLDLMLARSLLALGRRAEAIAWLRLAARGDILAAGRHLTHTDADAALAAAFAANGQPDSARVYRARVRRAVARSVRRVVEQP